MDHNTSEQTDTASPYHRLTMRNDGYITDSVQEKIKNTRLLIAGCGIGSSFAVLAARMGFTKFILTDGDIIEDHNLNRQFYDADDIGVNKATALARHLHAINPEVVAEALPEYLTEENLPAIVAKADFIFDTIDFLDLAAIVALHDQCQLQKKPHITALSIGLDAGALYFPADGTVTFREVFGLPLSGPLEHLGYIDAFSKVIERLGRDLDPQVIKAVSKALTIMENGKPCPASQVAPGSFSVASLAGTLMYRVIAGLPVTPAPGFIVSDVHHTLSAPGINLLDR